MASYGPNYKNYLKLLESTMLAEDAKNRKIAENQDKAMKAYNYGSKALQSYLAAKAVPAYNVGLGTTQGADGLMSTQPTGASAASSGSEFVGYGSSATPAVGPTVEAANAAGGTTEASSVGAGGGGAITAGGGEGAAGAASASNASGSAVATTAAASSTTTGTATAAGGVSFGAVAGPVGIGLAIGMSKPGEPLFTAKRPLYNALDYTNRYSGISNAFAGMQALAGGAGWANPNNNINWAFGDPNDQQAQANERKNKLARYNAIRSLQATSGNTSKMVDTMQGNVNEAPDDSDPS